MSQNSKIQVLAEISRRVNSIRSFREVLMESLRLSVEALKAERGAVILRGEEGEQFLIEPDLPLHPDPSHILLLGKHPNEIILLNVAQTHQ